VAKVLSRHASISVPDGSFKHVLKTKEWTPLEPGVVDNKYYARGIGEVAERMVKRGTAFLRLVSLTYG
jgi:hypothetical protein